MSNPYKNISTNKLYKKLDDMKIGDRRRQEVKREINNRVGRWANYPEGPQNNR